MAITLTCVLNLYSLPFPNIANNIRVDVSTQSNPTAIIATQTDTTPLHPARVWSFPGLERTNYLVVMNEIDASGNPLNQLAYFDVVPDSLMVYTVRNDEQIFPDITPGFVSGQNVIYFDGGTVAGTGNPGSSIQVNQTGNLGPINSVYSWYFSLKGTVATNATVQVNFTYDDNGQGLHSASVTSTVQSGWNLANVVTDLFNKMSAIASNVLYYTDSDNYSGVRVRSLTNNSGTVTITNIPATPGQLRPDYRGWNINPERRAGRGTMQKDVEYSWDSVSGKFSLLQTGDIFLPQELYNIDFDPLASPAGGSTSQPSGGNSFANKLITTNYSITKDDFGTNLIVEPASGYIELTLPAANTVAEGLPVRIEVYKTSLCCVKIVGTVLFPFGTNIFLLSGESIEIFVFVRSTVPEFRSKNAFGNFASVGTSVYCDKQPINSVQLNGTQCDILFHARLWQWIQGVPAAQKVAYSNWASNQTFYSLNSGNSFYVPNRSSLYPRTAGSGEQLSSLMLQQISRHKHIHADTDNPDAVSGAPFGSCGFRNKRGNAGADSDNDYWFTNDGSEYPGAAQLNPAGLIGGETRPNSYVINQYILL